MLSTRDSNTTRWLRCLCATIEINDRNVRWCDKRILKCYLKCSTTKWCAQRGTPYACCHKAARRKFWIFASFASTLKILYSEFKWIEDEWKLDVHRTQSLLPQPHTTYGTCLNSIYDADICFPAKVEIRTRSLGSSHKSSRKMLLIISLATHIAIGGCSRSVCAIFEFIIVTISTDRPTDTHKQTQLEIFHARGPSTCWLTELLPFKLPTYKSILAF